MNLVNFLFLCFVSTIETIYCLQQDDPSLANVEIDNSFIQFHRELIQNDDSLKQMKKTKSSFLPNDSQNLTVTDLIINQTNSILSCYTCSTDDDPACEYVNQTQNDFIKKCKPNEKFCSVLRIEYKIVKEDNWTLWMSERSCLETCEPICIKLGERTRLKFCNSCCNESNCNFGNSVSVLRPDLFLILIYICSLFLILK